MDANQLWEVLNNANEEIKRLESENKSLELNIRLAEKNYQNWYMEASRLKTALVEINSAYANDRISEDKLIETVYEIVSKALK